MKVAIHGLGRMGMQIARKLAEDKHQVIAHNRSPEPIDQAITYGAQGAYDKQEVLRAFGGDQVILWIMLPAEIVDSQLDEWLKLIPQGSLIIDGGNSDFRLTQQRAERVKQRGSLLFDAGTSGGVWGYQNGFSIMIGGGDQSSFEVIEPIFRSLTKPEGGYRYFGQAGSGHFVKMVHNAIEYGMMESLAEGYRMLKEGPYRQLDLASAAYVWQRHSVITSWLNELCQSVLKENPELKDIDGFVSESGEARWTLEMSKELNIPMPAIQASFDVRLASQKGEVNYATKLLAAMRNKFGGHNINKS